MEKNHLNECKFKVAAAQVAPVFLDLESTIEKACRLIQEAGNNDARIVVFPEAYIPGFPFWPKDAGTASDRVIVAQVFAELVKNSVEIPSAATEALCAAARKSDTYVVMGLNERDTRFGLTLYNSLLFIGSDGTILGKHRKLVPTLHERIVWGMGDGSTLNVFDTPLGKIGGLICNEHHMSLAKYALFTQGEQIHASVWPSHTFVRPIIDAATRQYAFEGQCFVIAAGGIISPDTVPDSFPLKELCLFELTGMSAIIGPRGNYLAGPSYDQEGLLYAEIDLDHILQAKMSMDTVGHYARPEVLSLTVNRQQFSPIRTYNGDDPLYQVANQLHILSERVASLSSANISAALAGLILELEERA